MANEPKPTIDGDLVRALEAVILVATEPVPAELLAQILDQSVEVVVSLDRKSTRLNSSHT